MRLVHFLLRELAPTPGRLRATSRILVGCLAALLFSIVLGGGILPHAHWTIITIFIVSQADAGASLRKSWQRVLGTLVGGLLGILAVIALADLPILYVLVLGAVTAFGLFASLTTTIPYVMLLGSLTFVLVTFLPPGETPAVDTGLWRILAIVIGVVFGTAAQLFLWPDDPEEKLRRILAARLADVARVLGALVRGAGRRDDAGPAPAALRLAGDDVMVQLDLLGNAEARHPSLRRHHTDQLSLIIEIDRLLSAAAWLVDRTTADGLSRDQRLASELTAIGAECSTLADALATGRSPEAAVGVPPRAPLPPAPSPSSGKVSAGAVEAPVGIPGLHPVLEEMWLSLERARPALGFLDPDRAAAPALDHPARSPLLTPAFSLTNALAVALALKAAIGMEICFVLMHALDWSALLTAAVTVTLISLTSLGATVQKSMLRVAGALVGGALGMAVIIVAMPNLQSVVGLLAVAALGFGVAAWITAGSSRISYMGLQAGMAFAMCVVDPSGPTTDLTPARDRVLGILIGVLVMMLLNAIHSLPRARLAMRPALARALRSIAGLARIAPDVRDYRERLERAVRLRAAVYGNLAATLRLSDESTLEPDAPTREAREEREWIARLVGHAQAVFLSLLALMRHRLSLGVPALPAAVQDGMRKIDDAVGDMLDALADRVERGRIRALPDLPALLAAVEAVAPTEDAEVAAGTAVAARTAVRDHVAIARDLVRQADRLRDSIDTLAPRAGSLVPPTNSP